MLRGIYIAGSGMLAESMRQDVVANNLANATTTGYRRSDATSTPFGSMLVTNMATSQVVSGPINLGSEVSETRVDTTQGPLQSTGNKLDFALVGQDGFFQVRTPAGLRYTRDGSFTLATDGSLTTKDGYPVMGVKGPIKLTPGATTIGVGQDGTVSSGNTAVDRMNIVRLDPKTLVKEGDSLMNGTVVNGQSAATVHQGYLEGSSVNSVSEMVELIRVMRSFEANQKAVQAQDDTLGQALTKVGVV
ncbi:MAG: flagellar basal-body rod protein FlgF [Thermoleophilia bacterium]